MSLLAAGNRHFSASALHATLHHPDLRHQNAKETNPPVQRNHKSPHFSDLCSLSIQFRGKRKKTKERKNSKEKVSGCFLPPIHFNRNVYRNPNLDSVQNVLLVQGLSEYETRRRRGRLRKIRNPGDGEIYVDENQETVVSNFSLTGEASAYAAAYSLDKTCSNLRTESRDGEELKRITMGLKTKEEVLGFLEQLNGEWVNTGKKKKKKVVKACDSRGYFPQGWKLMLCIKKKSSNLWLACGRYIISPDGQQFATCKEVSTCLDSLLEPRSKNQLSSLQSESKSLGEPVIANESLVGNFDSMDLPVLGTEMKQNLESGRASSEVFEEAKDVENSDLADLVRTSLVEKDDKRIPAADMKIRDNNMEDFGGFYRTQKLNMEKK